MCQNSWIKIVDNGLQSAGMNNFFPYSFGTSQATNLEISRSRSTPWNSVLFHMLPQMSENLYYLKPLQTANHGTLNVFSQQWECCWYCPHNRAYFHPAGGTDACFNTLIRHLKLLITKWITKYTVHTPWDSSEGVWDHWKPKLHLYS